MFDFKDLKVYQKALEIYEEVHRLCLKIDARPYFKDQFGRAGLSIPLNIAEGASRFSAKDRRRFYIISRGSVYECVVLTELLFNQHLIGEQTRDQLIERLLEVSKMLFAMIGNLQNQ
ncbi:MAG: four helix bundle protein [Flavobacteriales bacterium]|nr:four helix bundle protein [Flavobacteriales bacterium]